MDLADLDRDTLRELRSLGLTGNRVGKHLLTAASIVDSDPEEALRQLRAAVRRGARLPVVRETAGVVAYAAGDFALALRELRTATRLGVGSHLLPLIVDCERALGRPDRALELAAEADGLDPDTSAELAIVVSGIHRDAGDAEAALNDLSAAGTATSPSAGLRLRYARAEALLATGDSDAADDLFDEVARQDTAGITDAAERVAAAHGLLFDDIAEDDEDDEDDEDAEDDGAAADDELGEAAQDIEDSQVAVEQDRTVGAEQGPDGPDQPDVVPGSAPEPGDAARRHPPLAPSGPGDSPEQHALDSADADADHGSVIPEAAEAGGAPEPGDRADAESSSAGEGGAHAEGSVDPNGGSAVERGADAQDNGQDH